MSDLFPGLEIIKRRHVEYEENYIHWRWLLDSLEGGRQYRNAVYGTDTEGQPVMNLIRHKREYDPRRSNVRQTASGPNVAIPGSIAPGTAVGVINQSDIPATNDDFELRRRRTPVPKFLAEAIDTHLSKIYKQEVKRKPDTGPLVDWWKDVDGEGTTIDQWMAEVVGPMFFALGFIDIYMDRPRLPDGTPMLTEADARAARVNRCIASFILPDNLVWWELDSRRRYAECLVRVYDERSGDCLWRHWTGSGSWLYDDQGEVLEFVPHDYGRPPIVRLFDQRKWRYRNVGHPRWESVADRQKEYYNRDSELILSDTLQAHPLLQGPDDYVQGDNTIPIGPSNLLPKKSTQTGNGGTHYEGFDVIEFPKGGAESIRANKGDIRDEIDRDTKQTKPAGAHGTGRSTVAQSGISKQLDNIDGNDLLSKLAAVLMRFETRLAELAWLVTKGAPAGETPPAGLNIDYPTTFNLFTLNELADAVASFQVVRDGAGGMPQADQIMLEQLLRLMLPGLKDEIYAQLGVELEQFLEDKAAAREAGMEAFGSAAASIVNGTSPMAAISEAEATQKPGRPAGGVVPVGDVSPADVGATAPSHN